MIPLPAVNTDYKGPRPWSKVNWLLEQVNLYGKPYKTPETAITATRKVSDASSATRTIMPPKSKESKSKESAAAPVTVPWEGAARFKGKKIGVQRATIHEAFVMATFKQSEIVHYATQDQAFLDLKSGRIDLTLAEQVAIDQGFLKKPEGRGFAFIGPSYFDTKYFGVGTGVGMRKADAATLGKKFNEAMAALRANGKYKQLNDKYFEYDVWPKP